MSKKLTALLDDEDALDLEAAAADEDSDDSASVRRYAGKRIQPKRRRRDPVDRKHVDGSPSWMHLKNPDPNVRYIFASLENPTSGVRYYEDLGYEVIRAEAGGVELGDGCVRTPEGEQIEMYGCVLMGVHKDDHEDIIKYGPDGKTGLAMYDDIEKKIVADGGLDPLRGKYLKHLRQANDTSGLEAEI